MHPALRAYLATLAVDSLSRERREKLDGLADHVQGRLDDDLEAPLTFICTHNSRRSHFGQIWAAVAAAHHDIEGVPTFSGGTEATAFNPRAVAAIERAGLTVHDPGGDNPVYQVAWSSERPALACFSKRYDHPGNPDHDFAAVMTCADADVACPVVQGAAFRVALPYEDPKAADGTADEAMTYDARCRQIATEMLYLMRALLPSAR